MLLGALIFSPIRIPCTFERKIDLLKVSAHNLLNVRLVMG